MKFIWNDNYSVGVKIIDEQHRHFFEIANNIYDLLENKAVQKENLFNSVNELCDYAFYHLNTEEEYFKKFNYEDTKPHIDEHNEYRKKVQEYLSSARDEKTNVKELAAEVAGFSNDWLSHHIIEMDKKYTPFFHAHGLE